MRVDNVNLSTPLVRVGLLLLAFAFVWGNRDAFYRIVGTAVETAAMLAQECR